MNILILTGRFGMGHYSVSEALVEKLEGKNVKIVDIIDYMYPTFSSVIYKTFNFTVSNCPKIYNYLNGMVKEEPFMPFKDTSMSIKKIDKLLKENETDIVVSNFPLCSHYISDYKEKTGSKVKLYTYITDVTMHEEWITKNNDLYFVGDDSTKEFLESKGIDEKEIIISGIPIKKVFNRDIVVKNNKNKNILIMGGGLGVMPFIGPLLQKISNNNQVSITVITGKNEKLAESLRNKYPNIEVLGYVNNMHEYMERASLLITKSGGITTFEAIYSQTPLFIIKPFLKQEIGNAYFILDKKIGLVEWNDKKINCEEIMNFLFDDELQEEIQNNMIELKKQFESVDMNSYYGDA